MTATRNTRPQPRTANPDGPVPDTDSRISFRQPVSKDGFVDAAWWPRTRDLSAELPALMDVLWSSAREVSRVSYNLDAWDAAPKRLQVEGRTVRLGGFHTGDPLMIRLADMWGGERVDVLVVDAGADPAAAGRALALAARPDNPLRPAEILAQAGVTGDDA